MSGGYFAFEQSRITDIADEIEWLIKTNDSTEKDKWGDDIGRHYSSDTILRFKEGVRILRQAYIYAQRIDWLVSDDDGEDAFHERLDEELRGEGEK